VSESGMGHWYADRAMSECGGYRWSERMREWVSKRGDVGGVSSE
jgi:hypothetical protein